MNFPSLNEKNIYMIPAGDIWGIAPDRIYLIYSALSGHILLLTRQEAEMIEQVSSGLKAGNDRQQKMLETFLHTGNRYVFQIPATADDIYEVDILPNFRCNFSCSYCYSAKSRSSKELSLTDIETVIDYLFSPEHPQKRPYKINFSGGGEPLLSFPLIREAVNLINEKAANTSIHYGFGIVTNGSLLNHEIIDFIIEKKIDLVVSFEVLQEFQDKERGNYRQVASNIDRLLDRGCGFGIKATITPLSVHAMKAMVEELNLRFPKIKSFVLDTVLSEEMFKTPQQLETYYHDFTLEYYEAKEYGKKIGIAVQCNALEPMSLLRARTCQGKIVLTPDGVITSCARVSSPQDRLYDKFTYGKICDGKVVFDSQQLQAIMSANNIHSREECKTCFARWNCGGGCWLFTLSFSQEFEKPFCDFTRNGLKQQLYHILCANYYRSQNKDLHKQIAEKIAAGEI